MSKLTIISTTAITCGYCGLWIPANISHRCRMIDCCEYHEGLIEAEAELMLIRSRWPFGTRLYEAIHVLEYWWHFDASDWLKRVFGSRA